MAGSASSSVTSRLQSLELQVPKVADPQHMSHRAGQIFCMVCLSPRVGDHESVVLAKLLTGYLADIYVVCAYTCGEVQGCTKCRDAKHARGPCMHREGHQCSACLLQMKAPSKKQKRDKAGSSSGGGNFLSNLLGKK